MPLYPKQAPDLPLAINTYSTELRQDIMEAIRDVIREEPSEITPVSKENVAEVNLRDMPDSVPSVVGLCGKPRAGKDVVAEYIIKHYKGVTSFAFSDGIREEVNRYLAEYSYDSGRKHFITPENKSEPHYRHLLQAWGNARRAEDPNYWAKQGQKIAKQLLSQGARLVIITGVRAPGEVEAIHEMHGDVLRVVRPGNTYAAEHSAETGLDHLSDDTFITIYNTIEDNLEAYEENIEAVLHDLPQPHLPVGNPSPAIL